MSDGDVSFYEHIVVGCGGIGSATVYWLSRRGNNKTNYVLGLEQFTLGHHNGGSQDVSRIIRLMYDEEIYTKLTPATYKAWAEVESESGLQLVYKTGSLELAERGTPNEKILNDYVESMGKQGIPYERLDRQELRRRYPQFTGSQNLVGLLQKDGGLVDAALANAVHTQLARAHGATLIENCAVTGINVDNAGITTVITTRGKFRCRRVILTAGSWTNQILGSVGVHVPMVVTQEQVTYYATPNIKQFTKNNFPVFMFYSDQLCFYGLPIHCNSGTKIGLDASGNEVTPDTRTFIPDPLREERCEQFLAKNIPGFLGPKLYTKTCLYAMPYDRRFVIDTLASKGKPQIIVCIGAGHAYKWACLFGKVLSEIAVDGSTPLDIAAFTLDREAITNPSYKPVYSNTINLSRPKL